MRNRVRVLASSAVITVVALTTSAFAQESLPAGASAPGCTLGSHPAIDDADAQTSAELVCHELALRGDTRPREVRMGRLASKILLTVSSPDGAREDKHLFINSIEEVPTAAPRLADAASERRPIEDTQRVDNIVGGDMRSPKVKPGQIGVKGGVIGALPIGASTAPSPGLALGLLYRAGRIGVDAHARGGTGGGSSTTLGHFAFGSGAHYYFTDSDFSPYVGTGLALLGYKLTSNDHLQERANIGAGAYGEIGIEGLRTHHTALVASVRADVPMFELAATHGDLHAEYRKPTYIVPVSMMVGVLFH